MDHYSLQALALVKCERIDQELQSRGPEDDDGLSSHDWITIIVRHLGRAAMWPWDINTFRRHMIQVAALAIAAHAWTSRNME